MTFDINRVFKVVCFVWGNYDGKQFRQSGFLQTCLPYLWAKFWWIFTIFDIFRYLTLAIVPRQYGGLEFYLGESKGSLEVFQSYLFG